MDARTSELHLQPANNFMEVSKAWSRHPHHVFLTPRSLSCLLGSRKPSSKCMYRRISFENAWKFRLGCTKSRSRFRIPVMSAKKGSGRVSLEGLCEVVWNIEADLPDGQLLYLSGEPTQLGCWQPHKAIRMFPTEHTNLWRAQVKMPPGNFKYNYFMTKERSNLSDMKWRTGPEVSLSVPFSVNQDSRVLVRDSWAKFSTARPPTHGWDSWIEDAYLAVQPSALPTDELETLNRVMNDIKEAIHSSKWKVKDTITCADDDSKLISYERDQPIEEPWLPLSSNVFTVHEDKSIPDISGHVEDDVSKLDVEIHNYKAPDLLPPADGSNLISKEDSVSTIILINSSICTMQRIAVLEDAKLVELLLEPVKTNVQCDSVYLGVVTKLVPHMGGAFVNIGSPRPSFMDIKQTREPFIFPPFRQGSSKEEENGSVLDAFEEEHPLASENESILPDVEEFISRDDLLSGEEHDIDDDFDTLEEKKHLNGSIVDHGEAETHFGNFLDLKNHLQAETTDGPLDSLISHLQDTNASINGNKWSQVRKGTKIIVQVVKEGLGTKGPTLTAYPKLKSRFWILSTRCDRIGVSKKVSGVERTRLRVIAKTLQPPGFGLTVRTVAAGHSLEELQKDLEGLLATWKNIREDAKSSALAADEGVEGAIPVILHRAMGQTLSVVQDYFNEKVQKLVVDSPRTYHEVTNYLQDIAPDLCNRVELHRKRTPLFDEFCIEEEINHILSKRVPLANGGSLVIEQTEALVSIDVNGGHVMFGQGTSQEKAILDVNLAAAKQIARELRLRDIGGIIVVDFIDMEDESSKRLVYEEMKEAVERDRSTVKVSELSKHGLMEITRKRVRPSVTFMISEPCSCCHATGRVEALETSFSKIEQEICRLLVMMDIKSDPENPKTWPRFILRVDQHMSDYLTSGKRKRLAILSSSLKVWLLLKVARGFTRGAFEVKPFTEETASKNQHQIAIQVIRRAEARTSKSGRKVTLFPIKKNKTSGK